MPPSPLIPIWWPEWAGYQEPLCVLFWNGFVSAGPSLATNWQPCSARPFPAKGWKVLFLYWDPGILFYDEQVPLKERQALFRQVVRSLVALKERGQGCYLFQGPISRQVKNQHFGRELSRSVQWVIRVNQGEQGLEGKLLKAGFDGERIQGGRG